MISDHLSQTAFLEYYYSSLVKIKADVRYNVSIIVDIVWQKSCSNFGHLRQMCEDCGFSLLNNWDF